MKPKRILTVLLLAMLIGLTGVYMFTVSRTNLSLARFIMGVGLLLHAVWIAGVLSLLYKRYFRKSH